MTVLILADEFDPSADQMVLQLQGAWGAGVPDRHRVVPVSVERRRPVP